VVALFGITILEIMTIPGIMITPGMMEVEMEV